MEAIEEKTIDPVQAESPPFSPVDIPAPVESNRALVYQETMVSRWLLCFNPAISSIELIGRAILWVILLAWGLKMITGPVTQGWNTWLHYINLPIHETGHLLFMPFGQVIYFLGGSIFQILLPAIFAASFLIWKRDAFAAAVMLWWSGQNFIDVAPYINDARAMTATLVGGNTHDWNWLLTQMGKLHLDHQIANTIFAIGAFIMIFSTIWAAWILWVQAGYRMNTQSSTNQSF